MIGILAAAIVAQPVSAPAPVVQPSAWKVASTVVDLAVPGIPHFLVRMARGKTKAERKSIAAGEGIDALLAPDPKARCRIESQRIAEGRYAQTLACPQKEGAPMIIVRTGGYDATGFAGQAVVTGTTPKGALRIVLAQRATRIGT